MEYFNLQLFAAGDGAGAGASAGAAAAGTGADANSGAQGAEAAAPQYVSRSGRSRVPFPTTTQETAQIGGSQQEDQTGAATGQDDAAAGQDQTEESFESLIKGKYKADFDQRVQKILNGRFKQANETQAQMDKISKILPALYQKYGLGEGATLDDLANKVTDDDSLYEDEAMRMGVSTEVVRDMHKLQNQLAEAQQAQQQTVEEMRVREHLANLAQQAEQLKAVFPGFDLMTELNNSPEFARMTSPEVGIPVETAYRAVHAREIEAAAMQYGAQRAATQVAASVKANGQRPAENGMGGQAGVASRVDPSSFGRKEIEEIKRRLARGENISFG